MIKRLLALFFNLIFISTSTFAQTYAAGACNAVPNTKTCVDTTPCKTDSSGVQVCLGNVSLPAGAVSVPQTCWQYSYQFACSNAEFIDTCSTYASNANCSVLTTACTDTIVETGKCDTWNYTYQCETKPATTEQKMVCDATNLFDSSSLQPPPNTNNSFGNAAVAMEIAREMQIYSKGGSGTVFNGEKEDCTKGYFGLKNCCSATPGAQSNASFVQSLGTQAAMSGVKYVGEEAVDTVSPYVFDSMYSSGMFSDGIMNSIAGSSSVIAGEGEAIGTNLAANGMTFGAYGFTYGTGTFEAASALPGTMEITTFGEGGAGGFVSFNPYVLVAMLVIQFVMSLMACSQDEQILAMHKGANLSVFVDEECASKVLGSCVLHKDNYCSFNSVLAAVINQQGKAQLGLDFSTCTGLTIDQVTALDFTKIDFSKFTASIMSQAQNGLPTSSAISKNYAPVMQNTSAGTTQTPLNGLAYPPTTP